MRKVIAAVTATALALGTLGIAGTASAEPLHRAPNHHWHGGGWHHPGSHNAGWHHPGWHNAGWHGGYWRHDGWHRGYGYGYGYGYDGWDVAGAGVAGLAAGAAIGAAVTHPAYGYNYGYGYAPEPVVVVHDGHQYGRGHVFACERAYRSYNPRSNTYIGPHGGVRVCRL